MALWDKLRGRVSLEDKSSAPDDHDFSRLDERVNRDALFQAQCLHCVARDNRRNRLSANINTYLHKQTFLTYFLNSSTQFVTTADSVEADWFPLTSFSGAAGNSFKRAAGNAMIPACRFGRVNLVLIDPLLQSGITNASQSRRFSGRQKIIHPFYYLSMRLSSAILIHLYTL